MDALTEHQRDTLRLYIRLGSYKAVAYERKVSEQTVKNTMTTIRQVLGDLTTIQACIWLDRDER